jgi:hypothetical protein
MFTGFYLVQYHLLRRFEVPLRPELWSDFAAGAVPPSDSQQRDDRPARQHSPLTGRGRTKSVRRRRNSSNDPSGVAGGSHVRKTRRTTPRLSGRMECPAEQSTRMTDYYDAQGEREVRPIQFFYFSGTDVNSNIVWPHSALLLLSFFVHFLFQPWIQWQLFNWLVGSRPEKMAFGSTISVFNPISNTCNNKLTQDHYC